MNNLESENVEVKVQALLSTIYNVRCNMQHGEKHFEEHQRMLLEPIIKILQTIVNLQIEKITAYKSSGFVGFEKPTMKPFLNETGCDSIPRGKL